MNLSVIGTGHVGLVTGACFADLGHQIVLVDHDVRKLAALRRGRLPFYEPGLEELVRRGAAQGRIRFAASTREAVRHGTVIFLCVGTPSRPNGEADLTAVEDVARRIAQAMRSYRLIVEKSTVPVETGEWIKKTCRLTLRRGVPFDVASNPEFLREGQAIHDFMHPDRIVLGVESKRATDLLTELYAPLKAPMVVTDVKSAELIKHASNSFLALKISYVNAVAQLCERVGADVVKVAEGMGLDPRIGPAFLNAGVGYGGSCLAGDELVLARSPSGAIDLLTLRDVVETPRYLQEGCEVFSFDPVTGRSMFRRLTAVSQRDYEGTMLTFTTRMNKSVTVTADHPMLVHEDGTFVARPAACLRIGDHLPCPLEFPDAQSSEQALDLVTLLQRRKSFDLKAVKVRLRATQGVFCEHHPALRDACRRAGIPIRRLYEIERSNCMDLSEYLRLEEFLPFGRSALLLFTTLGTPTYLSAVIPMNEDFWQFLGYFVAEGWITCDRGLRGIRSRVNLVFHESEQSYLDDVRHMLERLGVRFVITRKPEHHTVMVTCSSRLLAFLLDEVLKCGRDSYTARVPAGVFQQPASHRLAFLRGVFRGDGSVGWRQNTPAVVFDFGSISSQLIRGLVMLFHSIGIVPSYKISRSAKSTAPAHFLRISGFRQIQRLRGFKDAATQQRIDANLARYQRYIKPTGLTYAAGEADSPAAGGTSSPAGMVPARSADSPYALVAIKRINRQHRMTPVYSLEVDGTHTFVTTDSLVVHNCFPKDVSAFIHIAEQLGIDFQLLKATARINADQRRHLVKRVEEALWNVHNKTIAVLGLSFKPETDDVREAPAVDVIRMLRQAGARIRLFDPKAMAQANGLATGVRCCKDVYDAVRGADCLVVMTEWNEFKELDFAKVKSLMRQPVVVDGRNIYNPAVVRKLGFRYVGIGRGHAAD